MSYMIAYHEGERRWRFNHGEPTDLKPLLEMRHFAHSRAHTRFPSRESMRIITHLANRIKQFNPVGDTMITETELEEKLETRPAPRVTKEAIEARIKEIKCCRFSGTVTICEILLDNGYSVRGESACVTPDNYDQEIGEKIAYDNAFRQLWPLFGFLLAETQFVSSAEAAKVLAGE